MERADLWALVCDVYCDFVTFLFGILGQVWYFIVSISDHCCLSYFVRDNSVLRDPNGSYFKFSRKIKSIYQEFEGGIEKSVPRITDWHHEACRVMTSCDHEGWIFLSHPHTNNGFFFLHTTKILILYWKKT